MLSEFKQTIIRKGFLRIIPDSIYLKILYRYKIGKKLDLKNPKTYTEKLQWLKLYNRNELYTTLVDKYRVREYVKNKIGEEYLIPLIGGPWNSVQDIPFEDFSECFVLKTTHDSGGIVVCKDKASFNWRDAREKLEYSLSSNYYWRYREWPYKNVKPCIFAEKYMVDESGYELKDYKFFVFNGKVKALYIASDRSSNTKTCFDFFDCNFKHLPILNGYPNSKRIFEKPDQFLEMIDIAEKLGKGFPHVRIDLYNINGKIFFGEYTFFHMSGIESFEPQEWDYKFGEWLVLPERR